MQANALAQEATLGLEAQAEHGLVEGPDLEQVFHMMNIRWLRTLSLLVK